MAETVTKLYGYALSLTGLTALVLGALVWHTHDVKQAVAAERAMILDNAHYDSTLVRLVLENHGAIAAKTDTVVDTVIVRTKATKSVAARVPDTVRIAYPVVDTLVVESTALAHTVDTLVKQYGAFKASAAFALSTANNQIGEARLVNVRLQDERATLIRRPTRKKALALAGVAGGIGFVAGVLR